MSCPFTTIWSRAVLGCVAATAMLAAALCAAPARADTDETFKGKTVTLYIGNPVAGGYDTYGRLLARHIGDHLPGHPTVVASNLVGGQSITAANFLYNLAPRDGTAIGLLQEDIAVWQLLGAEGARFDVGKFAWIGRMASTLEVTYVWHDVPVNSVEDVKTRETLIGGNGPNTVLFPIMLNAMIGTRFKPILGFPGTQAVHLAVERGEVEGAVNSLATLRTRSADWLDDHKIRILMQHTAERSPELPDVPAAAELVQGPVDKEVMGFFASTSLLGRSFMAPPSLPQDVVRALRDGFDATMQDPQFLAEARKLLVDLDPAPGSAIQRIVEQSLALSPEARARAQQFRWR